MRARHVAVVSAVAVAALSLAACSSSSGKSSGSTSSSSSSSSASAGASSTASGGSITVYTGFSGKQAQRFADMIAPFEKQTGIKVTHVDIANIQTALTTRVAAGNPPDIALIPQPGLVDGYAKQGKIKPLDDVVDVSKLRDELVPGLADTTTVDGKLYAIPVDVSVKSLVWYPPAAFQKAGYQVPQTFEQFQQLVDKMRADGNTPLCLGVESGSGTGWAATDWFEDLLRPGARTAIEETGLVREPVSTAASDAADRTTTRAPSCCARQSACAITSRSSLETTSGITTSPLPAASSTDARPSAPSRLSCSVETRTARCVPPLTSATQSVSLRLR